MSVGPDPTAAILETLDRNLRSIWQGDIETYRATTSEDLSFFEWYISPVRIDGLDFHLREIAYHAAVLAGDPTAAATIEHEILNPRVQLFGDTAIVTYTLLLRTIGANGVAHRVHNETRVFHNYGSPAAPQWKLVHCHKSPIGTHTGSF
jgi:ketosteroid isomerase-like protein